MYRFVFVSYVHPKGKSCLTTCPLFGVHFSMDWISLFMRHRFILINTDFDASISKICSYSLFLLCHQSRLPEISILFFTFSHDSVIKKLSSIFSTIIMNFFMGIANVSSFLPTKGRAETSNIPIIPLG